jgi:hypothetical protein
MLLGSVPRPPRKPRSSTSTQSARHSTVKATSTGRISRGRPLRNAAPVTPSAATATRLTANPCAAVKEPKLATQADRKRGCEVPAIEVTMLVSVPACPRDVPCQNPRPGQACSTAMPTRNNPVPAIISRPSRGVRQARSGSAIRAPATA